VVDLFDHHNVILAYLFGSEAQDESGPPSDVNIGFVRAKSGQASPFSPRFDPGQ
jgi:predicted nucleotidyltransferase